MYIVHIYIYVICTCLHLYIRVLGSRWKIRHPPRPPYVAIYWWLQSQVSAPGRNPGADPLVGLVRQHGKDKGKADKDKGKGKYIKDKDKGKGAAEMATVGATIDNESKDPRQSRNNPSQQSTLHLVESGRWHADLCEDIDGQQQHP